MKDNNQHLHGGDSSTNYQANRDITVTGLTYSETERLFITMFKANFYDLQEEAKDLALKRAEEITNKFLEKLRTENPQLIENTKEPDVRFGIYEVQKAYARSGNVNTGDMLINLLVERVKKENESLAALVLNEALTIIPKITKRQIDILTSMFLVRNCKVTSETYLLYALNKAMPHDFIEEGEKISFYEHLIYTGVISHDITVMGHQNLQYLINANYPKNSNANFDVESHVSEEEHNKIFNNWDKSLMKGYALTSVGKAIALTNYNLLFNMNLSLSVWIND